MIYDAIEVFRKQAGLTPSLDTQESDTCQCVLVNFDKDDQAGGYIAVRLEDGIATILCFTADGDVLHEKEFPCELFNPIEENK